MRPKVLVLNFENAATEADARAAAERQVVTLGEGSRYHGYSDLNAPIFLRYEIYKVVDLRDNPVPPGRTNPSSTLLPIGAMGFDTVALFSAQFNELYGVADPKSATPRSLSLCELFEQGIINEVWILDGEPQTGPHAPYNIDRKQMYDENEVKRPGMFAPSAGGDVPLDVACGVSVRIAHLDRFVGPGCDLFVRGRGIEDMGSALPSMQRNAQAFVNRDFDTRFRVRFTQWSEICPYRVTGDCVTYPSPTVATGTFSDGMTWTIDPFQSRLRELRVPAQRPLHERQPKPGRGDVALRALRSARGGRRPEGSPTRRTPSPRSRRWTRTRGSVTAPAVGRSTGARASPATRPRRSVKTAAPWETGGPTSFIEGLLTPFTIHLYGGAWASRKPAIIQSYLRFACGAARKHFFEP